MDKVVNSIPVQFSNYQQMSETVSKVKIYILYAGENRNGSYISKESVEKAIPSLYGCPVVGEYKEKIENFGDHGGKVTIDSDGIKYEVTTKPYGFVSLDEEHANLKWEEVEDEEGNKKNYLVCDAYLWRKRYPELDVVFENGSWQSMELDVNEYEFKDDGYVDLKDFTFDALCILGKSENPDENVEPCFEDASIHSYSLKKDEFKVEFSLMMKEIKDEITKLEEDSVDSDFVEKTDEDNELDAELDSETKVDEVIDFEKTEDKLEKDIKRDFELSYSDIENSIYELLNPEYDEDGYRLYKYWICDLYSEYVVVRERETSDFFKIMYTSENDEIMLGEKVKVYSTWLTEDEKNSLESMKSEYSIFKENELKLINDKIESDKDEIFEKYDELLLENQEYESMKEHRAEYGLDVLESKLAVLYVQSNVQFSNKSKKVGIVTINNESNDSKPVADPYGGLFNLKK